MKIGNTIRRLLPIAGALVLTLCLTACTAPMTDAAVDTYLDENGFYLPTVSGFLRDDQINQKLASSLIPYADQMASVVDESDGRLSISYELVQDYGFSRINPKYRLKMKLTDGTSALEIVSAHISALDNVSVETQEDLAWLTSADLAESVLVLRRTGMETDLTELDRTVGERDAAETFVRLYEAIAEQEYDASDVTIVEDGDEMLQKILKLGLVDSYGEYMDVAYIDRVVSMAAVLMDDLERDVYGRQSESVTGEEFAQMLRTLHAVYRVNEIEDSPYRWEDLGKVDTDAILGEMEMTDSPFTRRDGAEMLCRFTTAGPAYSMKYSDRNLDHIEDSDSIWVRRAVTHGFMGYYGESYLFGGDQGLTVTNAIRSAKIYLSTRYGDWNNAVDDGWGKNYTKGELLTAAGKLAAYFESRPEEDKYNFELRTVINDRDYNWFYSQRNTGDYSGVNCMPSIATMASHWYDQNSKATVRKMRATSDSTDGWTSYELRNALDAYDVPYTVESVSLENIFKAIDDGKIILAQYSDRPYGVSGHCYVIYGYRRFKDSATFIINDSDSLSSRAELFGRKIGNGDEVESSFSLWTIDRFVTDVTVIG